jgi:hypothetical protein
LKYCMTAGRNKVTTIIGAFLQEAVASRMLVTLSMDVTFDFSATFKASEGRTSCIG